MRLSPVEAHRLWAPGYDAGLNPLLALEARTMAGLFEAGVIGPVQSMRAVDVGCGTGRSMLALLQRGADVLGVDACSEMLAEAARKRGLRRRLVLGEAAFLPFRSAISDLTFCSFAIDYVADLDGALSEMARITKPGGKVVISDLHPSAISSGWTRSFRAGDSVYEIEHCQRPAAQFLDAAQRAGLRLQTQLDACFAEPERYLFCTAGREAMFAELSKVPALWLAVWMRP